MRQIAASPLTREGFAPFGDVIETDGAEHFPINDGRCTRYHDLAGITWTGEDTTDREPDRGSRRRPRR